MTSMGGPGEPTAALTSMGGPGEPTDEELVAAYVAGDPAAFDTLVRRHERRVYAIALRYFRVPAEAEDAAQDAFLTLLRRAETFTGASTFSTWMYRVTVNTCNDLARKRSRRPQRAVPDVGELADVLPATEDLLATRELRLELREALDRLDPETRMAVVLHDVEGVPYADIAERLGVKIGTVKSRIHRGHARLAGALAGRPGALGEPSGAVRPQTDT